MAWFPSAGEICETPAANIDHAVHSRFFTVRCRVLSLEIEAPLLRAGGIRAPLGIHINHVFSA